MTSDLSKHPELKRIAEKMGEVGLWYLMQGTPDDLRRWTEGFN